MSELSSIPKRAFSLEEVKPDERVYEVRILLKDVHGALAEVTKILADANVNLKTGSVFYVHGRPRVGAWASFIDISKATKDIEELREELEKADVVVDVKFEEPKPAPFETMHFPILHGSTRAVIMPIGTVWTLWEGLEKILLPSGLAAVHYDAGKNAGRHTAEHLREEYGLERNDLILAFAQAMKATGWGIIEFRDIDFERFSGSVVVMECFEGATWRRKPYKACDWTRGILAGFMSSVFGRTVETVEVKCLATGDEYCEFEIKTKI